MSKPTLGFVGVGRMGAPMASRLLAAGYAVTVFDTSPAAVQALVAQGGQGGRESPRGGEQGRNRLHERSHAGHRAQGCAGRRRHRAWIARAHLRGLVDDRSESVRAEVGAALAKASRPIVMVDCPVSGGVAGAEKGTLTLMVAGPRECGGRDRADPEGTGPHLRLRRQARAGADGQGRQQPDVGRVHGRQLRDARARGARRRGSENHDGGHQREQRAQRRDAGQGPAPHPAPDVRFRFLDRRFRTRTQACASTRPRALGVPLIMGNAARQVLTMTKAEFGPDADFTNMIRLYRAVGRRRSAGRPRSQPRADRQTSPSEGDS